jgi:DNA-binding NtrC family response regulator
VFRSDPVSPPRPDRPGIPDLVVLTSEESDSAGVFADRLPTLRESEDDLIAEALRRAEGNQGVAAGLLGLSRQALNKRLSRHRDGDDREVGGEPDDPSR